MRILIVDDERAQREALAGFLQSLDYDIATADSAQTALAYLYRNPVDVVLSDYKMPYMTGNDLLMEIRQRYPGLVALIITAFGTVETAVEAMKAGAWDFITKPVDLDNLEAQLLDIQKYLQGQKPDQAPTIASEEGFIAADAAMLTILAKAKRVAVTNATVLLTGETGTGKEELARYIHENSAHRKKQLQTVNCAALPANLVESELFGHVKGAFTGAASERTGYFENADGSTLFLDEIGDLSQDIQVKILRFLQNGEYQKVGSSTTEHADVRIIAATNVDLQLAVEQGDFREDLYYRLDVIRFHIPPLRERPTDIKLLAENFLTDFSQRHNRNDLTLTPAAWDKLLSYLYPGNVRELQNIIERAVVLSVGSQITVAELELPERKPIPGQSASANLTDAVQQVERDLIARTLEDAGGNQSECARRLGISERVLRYKLQKYHLR